MRYKRSQLETQQIEMNQPNTKCRTREHGYWGIAAKCGDALGRGKDAVLSMTTKTEEEAAMKMK